MVGAWYSRQRDNFGIWARTLGPSGPSGPAIYAPGSSENNRSASMNGVQRTALVARPGGGFYLAYLQGYPSSSVKNVLLWRFGAAGTTTIATANQGVRNAFLAGIANGPGGRLWVFWYQRNGALYASRTNAAATQRGGIVKVKAPSGTSDLVFGAWGEGSNGRLDLVAIQDRAIWHTQVLPGLLVKVKGAKARASSAFAVGLAHAAAATKQVTFTVSDAGKPLKGASVKVVGAGAKKTNAKGRATFTLKSGRYKVNVKKGGYSPSRLRIKVG